MNPLQFDKPFGIIVGWLSKRDPFLADDILSEMRISVLELPDNTEQWLAIRVAKFAAINFLRSRKVSYSYGGKFNHTSFESMVDSGFQFDTAGGYSIPSTKDDNGTYSNLLIRTDQQCDKLLVMS